MPATSFLTHEKALALREAFGTPLYVYDESGMRARARAVLAFPNAYGLSARYAMKALPTAAVVRLLTECGLDIDASSGFEARRAMRAGVAPARIMLTGQELPADFAELVEAGVLFNACSLGQLERYAAAFPGSEVCVRVNPGRGSGHSNRTNVGGPSASFGIWHEHLDEVFRIAERHGVTITRMHTHIGSGADPEAWVRCARLSLTIAACFSDVHTLSLGGGYKVGRMPGEPSADMEAIGRAIVPDFEAFARENGRKLRLEIEPGTFLVANAGALLGTVAEVVDTGPQGCRFIKADTGMTELARTCMYGAQHPIEVVPADETPRGQAEYLVAGHCCESGDILTPAPGDPEGLGPRLLTEAKAGDLLVVGGAGAYCSSMAMKNYNSFPEAAEALLGPAGQARLIRKRQTLEQMLANEVV